MTFDELRIKLGGGPVRSDRFRPYCEVPVLRVEVFDSIPVQIEDTGFPGCFRFFVPVDEGDAMYTGVVEIGPIREHGRGKLELLPWLG